MADNNPATNRSIRNKFVGQAHINADVFSVDQTTKIAIIDLHPFLNSAAIQVNSKTGTLTADFSWDGVNFSNTATLAVGITAVPVPCRYVRLSIDTSANHVAAGLVCGSLY